MAYYVGGTKRRGSGGYKKKGKDNAFYHKVSIQCNYADPDHVREIYRGLLKAILKELSDKGSIYLPEWGRYFISNQKPKRIVNYRNTGRTIYVDAVKILKFRTGDKLRAFIKKKM